MRLAATTQTLKHAPPLMDSRSPTGTGSSKLNYMKTMVDPKANQPYHGTQTALHSPTKSFFTPLINPLRQSR